MPCVVILIPKHSFCNTVCVCMVMQIKLVVVVVTSSILIMIDRSAHVSNSFKTYALSVEIICYCFELLLLFVLFAPWALIKFLDLESGRLFEVGAYSRLGGY